MMAAPPGEHEEGDPAGGAQLLEQDVGGHLEQAVGTNDQKDHEGDGELVAGHVGRSRSACRDSWPTAALRMRALPMLESRWRPRGGRCACPASG